MGVLLIAKQQNVEYHIIPVMEQTDYMKQAIEEARKAAALDEVPIGAVVVYDPIDPATRKHLGEPKIIARACNMRETLQDPSGHAEFIAMRAAAEALGCWRLTGCTVYVTLEPCPMCAGLMHQARVDACVFGAPDPKAGALGSLYELHADQRLNHTFDVTSGVCQEECADILKEYFARKRKINRQKKRASREGSSAPQTIGEVSSALQTTGEASTALPTTCKKSSISKDES